MRLSLFGIQWSYLLDALTRITANFIVGLQDLGGKFSVVRKISENLLVNLGLKYDCDEGLSIFSDAKGNLFETGEVTQSGARKESF